MDKNKLTEKEIKRIIRAAEYGRQFLYLTGFFLAGIFIVGGASDLAKKYGLFEQSRILFPIIIMLFSVIFLIFIIYISESKYILKCPYCDKKLNLQELKFLLSSKTCKYCNEKLISD